MAYYPPKISPRSCGCSPCHMGPSWEMPQSGLGRHRPSPTGVSSSWDCKDQGGGHGGLVGGGEGGGTGAKGRGRRARQADTRREGQGTGGPEMKGEAGTMELSLALNRNALSHFGQ